MHYLAAAILIIFPSTILGLNKIYGLAAIVAICVGFFYMYKNKNQIIPLSQAEKIIFFSVSLLYFSALMTALYNNVSLGRSSQYYTFVMIIPTYYFFKFCPGDKEKYLWTGLILGSFIALGIGSYDIVFGNKIFRAHGVLNPNIFGPIALIMGVMSLTSLGWFKERQQRMIIVPIIALLSGVLASLLSLSRGVWVVLFTLIVFYIWYSYKHLSRKTFSIIIIAITLSFGIIYNIPIFKMQQRFDIAIVQTSNYFDSDSTSNLSGLGSIDARLEMWKAALLIFKENPLLGAGWAKNYNIELNLLIEQKLINASISKYQEAHSIYLSSMAKGGLLALAGIFALFFIPLIFFIKILSHRSSSPSQQRIALAGILLLVSIIFNGLSESLLEKSTTINFLAFYLAVFLALASNKLEIK